jgi:hypothetical protein
MRVKVSLHSLLRVVIAFSLALLYAISPSYAGCGCDKPPPPPSPVIPHVAFGRMKITLFHETFQKGQRWTVVLQNGAIQSSPRKATVVLRRDISDVTGRTITPRLIFTMPPTFPPGPTSILVYRGTESFFIPASDFTVIGVPITVAEKKSKSIKVGYTTAIGEDGTLYFALSGLAKVCQPIKFKTLMEGNPLRFATNGEIVIINSQGFLIETLACTASKCTPKSHYFPNSRAHHDEESDRMEYWRHSFVQYCLDHRRGAPKAIDPRDSNWHQDGTPHVDYSALIFAISGQYDNGALPNSGKIVFDLNLESDPDDQQGGWEDEKEEEGANHH